MTKDWKVKEFHDINGAPWTQIEAFLKKEKALEIHVLFSDKNKIVILYG